MAILSRSKRIFDFVRSILGPETIDKIPDKLVFNIMTDVSRRLAEETLCIEQSEDLTVVAGTELYDEPDGFYRMKHLKVPSGALLVLQESEIDEINTIRTDIPNSFAQAPTYFYRWNGQIGLFPAPQAAGTYTVYYYALPVTELSTSVSPATPYYMDDAIKYGVLAELLPILGKDNQGVMYRQFYEGQLARAVNRHAATKSNSHNILYHDV